MAFKALPLVTLDLQLILLDHHPSSMRENKRKMQTGGKKRNHVLNTMSAMIGKCKKK